MYIANPIYDVVFKYLMEDNKIAKLIISSIIKEEIISLKLRPLEFISQSDHRKRINVWEGKDVHNLTVYKLDFSAKIKTETGSKLVVIEIQKAKFSTDIMRFRKYLGEQYANRENTYEREIDGEKKKTALPIISIYFIGHRLEHIKNVPVIKAERKYIDVIGGVEIDKKEDFIESLSHDSYVIQIPALKEKRRNELEILLSVFDQSNRMKDFHVLNVDESDYPPKYREIIRRLQKAVVDEDIRKKMDLEDEMIGDMEELGRQIEDKNQKLKEQITIVEEQTKALEEKDLIIQKLMKELENAQKK